MVIASLAAEIKTRHYQRFLRYKPPFDLSSTDVKEYLTYLAVKCHVAALTQNQAFNSPGRWHPLLIVRIW
jgi:hypothetical protein